MLIERRTYTLQPGMLNDFWDAQQLRADGLSPILQRLIGAFAPVSGMPESVVCLYRYDDFADWQTRLGGLSGNTRLASYFGRVRSMILRQENEFLVPAGLDQATPMWGNGNDWLPAHGASIPVSAQRAVVAETSLTFRAGGVPRFWQAFAQVCLADDTSFADGLLGAFNVTVGPLNRVRIYTRLTSVNDWVARQEVQSWPGTWKSLMNDLSPVLLEVTHTLLRPSPVVDMSPMFIEP
ncbi:NIPSNAP domain containing protein [Burkholderia cenocepacia]|uniref:NIPSNAP family protein n=1 Tax=Burkholderia cenocepacia TaxID=95486 RepID=UPI000F59807A|nr:NIPSNAP family protein [Burkholderia cenocepacia]RQU02048.1 NIPSNAP domain containing protein [Burkholderia cenocepacia]RQU58303.1 NIPSNAP domain containing protein [Burkholderia cenocepacia]